MVKRILILGATGFIGSNLLHGLREKYKIVGVDNGSFGFNENLDKEDHVLNLDISELSEKYLNMFDVMVSSYCSNIIYAMERPYETYINNVINGMKCFSKFNGKIIYLSTSSLYGNAKEIPTREDSRVDLNGAYATSKYIMEEYLKGRGNYTTLRLSNVYGPNQRPENHYCGVVNRYIYQKVKKGNVIVYGTERSSRDYTYVGDVVKAVEKCINIYALEKEINIGTCKETTIKQLAEKVGVRYTVTKARDIDNITRRCLNIVMAKKLLGWKPSVKLEEGILLTEEWIKREYV